MSLNQVTIVGNLGSNPKTAGTPERPIFNFSIATDYSYTDAKGERRVETDWHRVVAFGQTAKFLSQYASQGRLATVTGRLRTRKYEKDGAKHSITEIIADKVDLEGPHPDRESQAQRPAQAAQAQRQESAPQAPAERAEAAPVVRESIDDDIPF